MPQPLQSTPRPAPQLHPNKLRKTTTSSSVRPAAAAAALALLLFSATPALAAPGRSEEELAGTLHSAFAALWERVAAVPGVVVGVWEAVGAYIDPNGSATPPPGEIGAYIDPNGTPGP